MERKEDTNSFSTEIENGSEDMKATAFRWISLEAEKGNKDALALLEYSNHGSAIEKSERDYYVLLLKLLRQGAEQNNAEALRELGFLYYHGTFVPRIPERALELWTRAAELGDITSQYNVGVMYLNGDGCSQDDEKAFEWFLKAAENGHRTAQYNAGIMYHKGRGVEKDVVEAYNWEKKAAAQGLRDAATLVILYEQEEEIKDLRKEKTGPVSQKAAAVRTPLRERFPLRFLVSDLLILLFFAVSVKVLSGYLIPEIGRIYKLTAESAGAGDLESYFFSGAKWFTTSLEGYTLPEHKWYIVLIIAVMVQCITGELQSFFAFPDMNFGGKAKNYLVTKCVSSAIVSPVVTAFMQQLTVFFILSVCPQDIPLLFMLGEALVFCLPALVHKYLIRKDFSFTSLIFGVAKILILYLTAVTEAKIFTVLLFVIVLVSEYMESQPDGVGTGKVPGILPCVLYGLYVLGGILLIRPVVYTHMPEIEENVEAVYCDEIFTEENSTVYVRTDGSLVDGDNERILDDVRQKADCGKNSFYLTGDGTLMIYGGKGTIPAVIMENVEFIDSFRDALIILDKKGTLYGFGDFGNYLPGEPCYDTVTEIDGEHAFVKGDVGEEHILLIDEKADLYSLGCGPSGELGTGMRSMDPQPATFVMSGVKECAAGYGTSFAITGDGKLYSFGRNDLGQLGTGVSIPSYKIGKGYALNTGMTTADTPQCTDFTDRTFTDVAASVTGAFAVDEKGDVWAWGAGVSKESIAEPVVICHDILKVSASKYASGLSPLVLYLITEENIAVRMTSAENRPFLESTVEIIFDTTAWMPEPVEEISSLLEQYLDKINLRVNTEPEETQAEPKETVLKPVEKERHAVSWYKEFNGHKYRIYDEFLYMKTAETHCEAMGGHLAVITSDEELAFVKDMISERLDVRNISSTFHIGLTFDGSYHWVTGEDTAYIDAVHADQVYTSDDGEGCLRSNGRMNVGALVKMPYICEWEEQED